MRKRLLTFIEMLFSAAFFTGFAGLLANITTLFGKGTYTDGLGQFLPLVLTVIVSGIAVLYTKKFIFFFIFSFGAAFSVLLLRYPLGPSVVCIAASVLVVIIRLRNRNSGDDDFFLNTHYGFILTLALLYVIAIALKLEIMMKLEYYTLFICMILYFAHKNLSNLDEYFEYNSSVANVPTAKIRKTNYWLLAAFLSVTVILMVILPKLGLEKVIMFLLTLLYHVIRFIVSHLSRHSSGDDEVILEEEIKEDIENAFGDMETEENPAWLDFLINVLTYTLIGAVAIILLIGIGYGIYKIFKNFRANYRASTDTEEFILPNKDEKVRIKRDPGTPLWRDFSPNGSIRKAYRKMILKKKRPDRSSYTPTELEGYAGLEYEYKQKLLHEMYEKARYSEKGCTKEDVKGIK